MFTEKSNEKQIGSREPCEPGVSDTDVFWIEEKWLERLNWIQKEGESFILGWICVVFIDSSGIAQKCSEVPEKKA